MHRLALIVVLPALLATTALASDEPIIDHVPATTATRGEPLIVRATILSGTARPIAFANVFVRVQGVQQFVKLDMTQVPKAPELYAAELGPTLTDASFEYYLEAFDDEGNGPGLSGSPAKPYKVQVAAVAVAAAPSLPPGALSRPPPSKVRPSSSPSRALTWTLAGATAVAALVGGGLGWMSSDLRAGDMVSDAGGVRVHSISQTTADTSNRYAKGANVAFGVAGALAVGTGVTFAIDL